MHKVVHQQSQTLDRSKGMKNGGIKEWISGINLLEHLKQEMEMVSESAKEQDDPELN